MDTLFDLTKKRSGIVIRDGQMFACDWSSIMGIPLRIWDDIRGLGEPIPRMVGHWYDDLSEWVGNADFPGRRRPERGWVYMDGVVVIIAPDEWE